jgi:neutral amino acid transport system ATP-binding protein
MHDSHPLASPPALPRAEHLCKSFGGIRAIDQASIDVARGSITGLIGPNGAGKTTLFSLLSMFLRPDRGQVLLDGDPLHHLQPYQIAQRGMVRTFQVARVLSRLSVLENMLLGAQQQTGEVFWHVWLQPRQVAAEEREQRDRAWEILHSVGLEEKAQD